MEILSISNNALLPRPEVLKLSPLEKWHETPVKVQGVNLFVAENCSFFKYNYNPKFVGNKVQLKTFISKGSTEPQAERQVKQFCGHYSGAEKYDAENKPPPTYICVATYEGPTAKQISHIIVLVEYLSDCGNYCLHPSDGVAAENAWKYDYCYQDKLPLTDKNAGRFFECGVAKLLLQGVIGSDVRQMTGAYRMTYPNAKKLKAISSSSEAEDAAPKAKGRTRARQTKLGKENHNPVGTGGDSTTIQKKAVGLQFSINNEPIKIPPTLQGFPGNTEKPKLVVTEKTVQQVDLNGKAIGNTATAHQEEPTTSGKDDLITSGAGEGTASQEFTFVTPSSAARSKGGQKSQNVTPDGTKSAPAALITARKSLLPAEDDGNTGAETLTLEASEENATTNLADMSNLQQEEAANSLENEEDEEEEEEDDDDHAEHPFDQPGYGDEGGIGTQDSDDESYLGGNGGEENTAEQQERINKTQLQIAELQKQAQIDIHVRSNDENPHQQVLPEFIYERSYLVTLSPDQLMDICDDLRYRLLRSEELRQQTNALLNQQIVNNVFNNGINHDILNFASKASKQLKKLTKYVDHVEGTAVASPNPFLQQGLKYPNAYFCEMEEWEQILGTETNTAIKKWKIEAKHYLVDAATQLSIKTTKKTMDYVNGLTTTHPKIGVGLHFGRLICRIICTDECCSQFHLKYETSTNINRTLKNKRSADQTEDDGTGQKYINDLTNVVTLLTDAARIFATRNLRDVLNKDTIEGYCNPEIVLHFFGLARKIKAGEHAKLNRKNDAKKQRQSPEAE